MKEKIAFTVTRYGKDINGGAELHCRMLAERLTDTFDVEVLTTCIKNYVTGAQGYKEGVEIINGVTVRRFRTEPGKLGTEKEWLAKVRLQRRIRRLLYWCGCLKYVAKAFPVWKWRLGADIHAFKSSIFYSPEMHEWLKTRKHEYKAIISMTATYAPFFAAADAAGEKMIGIPTLHPERAAFRPALTLSFTKAAFIGYNTGEEQKLAENIFGKNNIRGSIISTGIDSIQEADWHTVKEKFSLPEKYVVFIGRIEKGKTGKLVNYYTKYCKKYPDAPKLVMVGGIICDIGKHENTFYTGFVSDEEKRSILRHALMLINPSKYESLSLVVLEALRDKVPVLVNGKCNVLKEHGIRSKNAILTYSSYREFRDNFKKISEDADTREYMKHAGESYFLENYSWDTIMPRLRKAIESISGISENDLYEKEQ